MEIEHLWIKNHNSSNLFYTDDASWWIHFVSTQHHQVLLTTKIHKNNYVYLTYSHMGSMISAKSFLKYSAWFFLNRKKIRARISQTTQNNFYELRMFGIYPSHMMDKPSGQWKQFLRCHSPNSIPTHAMPSHGITDYGKSKVEFPIHGGTTYQGRTSVVPSPRGRSSSRQRGSCPRRLGSGAVRSSLAADCQWREPRGNDHRVSSQPVWNAHRCT